MTNRCRQLVWEYLPQGRDRCRPPGHGNVIRVAPSNFDRGGTSLLFGTCINTHPTVGIKSSAEFRDIIFFSVLNLRPALCSGIIIIHVLSNRLRRNETILHLHGVPKLLLRSHRRIEAFLHIFSSHSHLTSIVRQGDLNVFHGSTRR